MKRINKFFRLRVHQAEDDGADIDPMDALVDELDSELDGGASSGDEEQSDGAQGEQGAGEGADDDDSAGAGDATAQADKSGDADGADAAAAKGDDAGSEDGAGKKPEYVPLATLLQERKDNQARFDELNRKFGRFETLQERLDQFQRDKEAQAAEANKAPPPDYLDDPKAYIDAALNAVKQEVEKTGENVVQINQQQEAQRQMVAVTTALSNYDTRFAEQSPDYYQALEHVREINVQNALDMGASEEEAAKQAAQAMFVTQVQAMRAGKDPAAFMYNIAKRFGYAGKAPEPDPADKGGKKAEDALDTLLKGQDAGSLGNGGSVDLAELVDADEDEFTATMESVFGKGSAR